MKTNQWFTKTLKTEESILRSVYNEELEIKHEATKASITKIMNLYRLEYNDAARLYAAFERQEKIRNWED